MNRETYLAGISSLAGDTSTTKILGDDNAIAEALDAMDRALKEAQGIRDENSGFFSTLKAQFTGAQIDTMKAAVTNFEHVAATMHATGAKLIADPNTTHDRVVDFIRSVYAVSNIDALKDSANVAKLSTLAKDVSNATVQDIKDKSGALVKKVLDATPLSLKVAVPLVLIGGIVVLWKLK